MYARNRSVPQQLCEFCHTKPKNGTHTFCSKACASQYALHCDHCHAKPKHGTYKYCGKNCALQANSSNAASGGVGAPYYSINTGFSSGFNPFTPSSGSANSGVPRNTHPVVPKLQKQTAAVNVAAHLPAGTGVGGAQPTVLGPSIIANQLPGPPGYVVVPPASQVPTSTNHPTKSTILKGNAKLGHSATTNQGNNNGMYMDECRIPGCGHPVYVDGDGPSEYCSMKHREEAVKAGLESPCIMCLELPQSSIDYFCGKGCREDALNK